MHKSVGDGGGPTDNLCLEDKDSGDRQGEVVAMPDRTLGNRQWTIKGIPPETVEQTRLAAKESGMKLNSWITSALRTAALEAKEERELSTLTRADNDVEPSTLDYMKRELAEIRLQQEQIRESLNTISSALLKIYAKSA